MLDLACIMFNAHIDAGTFHYLIKFCWVFFKLIKMILKIVCFMFVIWKLLYSTVEVIVQPSPAYLKLLYVGMVPKAFCLI